MSDDIEIRKGKTFEKVVRWETEPIIRRAITGIDFTAGAPRIEAVGHGLTDGWRAAVTMVRSPKQINAASNPPDDEDYHPVLVIDSDTVEFNSITPVDESGKEWPQYSSGGFIQYNTPGDLTGCAARMSIKDKVGGTVLLSLTTENGGIVIDPAALTITLFISDDDAAAITWKKGVYDTEIITATGRVIELLAGAVTVKTEITT